MESYALTLSAAHMQVLSSALCELPYRVAAPVIDEINRQIAEQQSEVHDEQD